MLEDKLCRGVMAEVFHEIATAAKFNITYIDVPTIGKLKEDGKYAGSGQALIDGDVHFLSVSTGLNYPNQPFEYGPVLLSDVTSMLSKKVTPDKVMEDLLSNFKLFHWTFLIVLTITMIIIITLLAKLESKVRRRSWLRTFWNLLHLILNNYHPYHPRLVGRVLIVLLAFALIVIVAMYNGLLKTDLVNFDLDKANINKLEQILTSTSRPIFIESHVVTQRFRLAAEGTIKNQVWSMTTAGNKSELKFWNAIPILKKGHVVLISQLKALDAAVDAACQDIDKDEPFKPWLGKVTFDSDLYAFPMYKNLSKAIKKRFGVATLRYVAAGFANYNQDHMSDKIRLPGMSNDVEFNRCVREAYSMDQHYPFVELKLGIYQWTIKGSLIVLAIAGLILIVERLWIKKSWRWSVQKVFKNSISIIWKVLKIIAATLMCWVLIVIKKMLKIKNQIKKWIKRSDEENVLDYISQLRTSSTLSKKATKDGKVLITFRELAERPKW